MPDKPETGFEWTNLFWPAVVAAESAVAMTSRMLGAFPPPAAELASQAPESVWTSQHEIVLELGAVRLRQFAAGSTR